MLPFRTEKKKEKKQKKKEKKAYLAPPYRPEEKKSIFQSLRTYQK